MCMANMAGGVRRAGGGRPSTGDGFIRPSSIGAPIAPAGQGPLARLRAKAQAKR